MKCVAKITLLAVGFIALLPGCGKREAKKDTWKEFTSKEGGFSVLMPKQPVKRKQTAPSDAGPINVYMFTVNMGVVDYGVMYHDIQGKVTDPESSLDAARDGAVKSARGVLMTEKEISLDGNPGREIRIKARDNIIYTARIYLVRQRFYQTMVTVPEGVDVTRAARRFMDSFKLM